MKNRFAVLLLIFFIAPIFFFGCASLNSKKLLPSSKNSTESPWSTYEGIEKIYNTIKEGQTLREVEKIGICPDTVPNLSIVSIQEIRTSSMPNASIALWMLSEGEQRCIEKKDNCFGWQFELNPTEDKRVGSFWLDTFGIKRKNIKTGFKFSGRILFVKDPDNKTIKVVHVKQPVGKPKIKEHTETTKPLGPLQTAGEQAIRTGIDLAL